MQCSPDSYSEDGSGVSNSSLRDSLIGLGLRNTPVSKLPPEFGISKQNTSFLQRILPTNLFLFLLCLIFCMSFI